MSLLLPPLIGLFSLFIFLSFVFPSCTSIGIFFLAFSLSFFVFLLSLRCDFGFYSLLSYFLPAFLLPFSHTLLCTLFLPISFSFPFLPWHFLPPFLFFPVFLILHLLFLSSSPHFLSPSPIIFLHFIESMRGIHCSPDSFSFIDARGWRRRRRKKKKKKKKKKKRSLKEIYYVKLSKLII